MLNNYCVKNNIQSILSGLVISFILLITLTACKKEVDKQSENKQQNLNSTKQNIAITPDSIILPQMDSFPFIDTVPEDVYESYYKTFERVYHNRPYWLKGEYLSRKLGYRVTITKRPNADFMEAILIPGDSRNIEAFPQENIAFKATQDPNELSSEYYELLDPVHALKYYHTTDSLYEIRSWNLSKRFYSYNSSDPTCHIQLNTSKNNYTAFTLDSAGNLIDKHVLFAFGDASIEYYYSIPNAFTIQIFKSEKKYNAKTGYTKYAYAEIIRYYCDDKGNIHDWSGHITDPIFYCVPINPDSILNPEALVQHTSVPLPLAFEQALKSQMLLDEDQIDYWSMSEEGNRKQNPFDRKSRIFFFQATISSKDNRNIYTVHDSEFNDCILVLSDKSNNILDSKSICGWLSPYGPYPCSGELTRDGQIYVFQDMFRFVPIDNIKLTSNQFISEDKQPPLIRLKYTHLEDYFPYKNVSSFDVAKDFPSDGPSKKLSLFPDSILNHIQNAIKLNGGWWSGYDGKNYSFNTTSFGLTYWITYSEAYRSTNIFVIDKTNFIRPISIYAAGIPQPEQDAEQDPPNGYSMAKVYGKFLNDSTYLQTQIGCYEDNQCDSIITAYRFLKKGKVLIDESLSAFYHKSMNADN